MSLRKRNYIDEARLDPRAKADAERAAKRKAQYKWAKVSNPHDEKVGGSEKYQLQGPYGPVAWITHFLTDEPRHETFDTDVIVPGVRGQTKRIGQFKNLETAQKAAGKELDI